MKQKPICILETCPEKPTDYHQEIFNGLDLYFVTYKKPNPLALSFNKNKSWAYNRNDLFYRVPKKYYYYCFIDYDVELNAVDNKSVYEELLLFVEKWNPVMFQPYYVYSQYGDRRTHWDEQNIKSGELCAPGGFITHLFTCIHHSILNFVFPLPTQYGGFWDAASIINILLVPPFEEHIFIDYQLLMANATSSKYRQNRDRNYGYKMMEESFNWIKPTFGEKMYSCSNLNEFKSYYMDRRESEVKLKESNIEVDYYNEDYLSKYFNLILLSEIRAKECLSHELAK